MITIFGKFLAVMSVGIFYTNIPNYIHFTHGILVPYQWVFGFGLLALPLIVWQIHTSNVLRSPVVGWCFWYMLITILWFIPSSQSDHAWQEVRWRVLTVLELFMFLALFVQADTNKQVRVMLVPGVLLGVALNLYELFFPLSFSPIIGRAAGFYMNPTTSSLALVGGMIFAITVLPAWFRGIFILLVGVGVTVTFSRGGIIMWCIASVGLLLAKKISLRDSLRGLCVGVLLVGAVLFPRWEELLVNIDRAGVINANVEERLLWLTDPAGVQDASGFWRAYVAKRLWDMWAENPFLGRGTGSAYSAFEIPPHNEYLVFLIDHGVIGGLVFPLLLLAVIYRNRGKVNSISMLFGCTQAVAGFVSHTLLSEPQTLLLFALAATVPTTESDQWGSFSRISDLLSRFRQAATQTGSDTQSLRPPMAL